MDPMKKARMEVLKHLSKQMHGRRFDKEEEDLEGLEEGSPDEEALESPEEEDLEGHDIGLGEDDDMDDDHDGTLPADEKKNFMKKGQAHLAPPKKSMTVVMQRSLPASFKGGAKRK